MPVAYSSANPDSVVFLALDPVPPGAKLLLTDNDYVEGGGLMDNEGVAAYEAPGAGLEPGDLFEYGGAGAGAWEKRSGDLQLSTAGDSLLLYCEGAGGEPVYIAGIGVTNSGVTIPESIRSIAAVSLPLKDSYVYTGPREGTKGQLQAQLSTPSNWLGGADKFSPDTVIAEEFQVTGAGGGGGGTTTIFTAAVAGTMAVLFACIIVCVAYISCCRKKERKAHGQLSNFQMALRGDVRPGQERAKYGLGGKPPRRQSKRPSGVDVGRAAGKAMGHTKRNDLV
jgi:hypothetical protein